MPRRRAARHTRFPHCHSDKNQRRRSVMPFTTAATGTRDAPAARALRSPGVGGRACRSQRRPGVAGIYILERAPRLIKSQAPCKSLANHGGTGSGTLLAAQRLEPWHGGTMNNKKLGLIAFAACLEIGRAHV